MEKNRRVLKFALWASVITLVIYWVITYTVPMRLKPTPYFSGRYKVDSPYKEYTIEEDVIAKLNNYIAQHKFRRITTPRVTYESDTVMFQLYEKNGHFLQVIYTLYYPPFSCIEHDNKYYQLDKEDRAFLHELIFGKTEEP